MSAGWKGLTVQIPLLRRLLTLLRRLVQRRDAAHDRRDLRPKRVPVMYGFRFEETATKHLRHVLFAHRAGILFHLSAEHIGHVVEEFVSEVVVLVGIGGAQRRHHGAAVYLDHGVREMLEETDETPPPTRIGFHHVAKVHERLVEKHDVPRSSRCGFDSNSDSTGSAGGVSRSRSLPSAVELAQPLRSGNLVGEDAPRTFERRDRAVGGARVDALFQINLVKAQRGAPSRWGLMSDVRFKLLDRGQLRQRFGIFYQMLQRDERMRLAAAVVDGERAVRLVASSRQPQGDILDQFPQVVRG